MKLIRSMMLGATLGAAPAALAQTAPTAAAPQTATPAAPAAGASAVSDSEVTQFATAALAVEKVRKDATVAEADKNAKMVEAISTSGIAPTRFNEIAQAMQADPDLNKRIQTAAAAQAQPAQ
ncbi:DUF4168 domain-containing protein [Sphingomonas sp. MMS12-HWE2-04]|uniref:DUF4168 domain-containing protein n=1 Tax=Sphingomonas sp. MMS12-HWE2-04 TaxID=3234199 RepID=UPI00384C9836